MRTCLAYLVSSAFLIGVIGVLPARADPISLTGGQVTARMNGGEFLFLADGLLLTAGASNGFAGEIFQCEPCTPGDRIPFNLGSSTGGHLSTGAPGEFNGVQYPSTNLFGQFLFTSTMTFTSATGLRSVTAPFTFRGVLADFADGAEGDPIFIADLVGSGTATAHFSNTPGTNRFFADSITYQFVSPTPEPASLLLLGSGALALLARRSRIAE